MNFSITEIMKKINSITSSKKNLPVLLIGNNLTNFLVFVNFEEVKGMVTIYQRGL
jgi:hypothetical protein